MKGRKKQRKTMKMKGKIKRKMYIQETRKKYTPPKNKRKINKKECKTERIKGKKIKTEEGKVGKKRRKNEDERKEEKKDTHTRNKEQIYHIQQNRKKERMKVRKKG